ncbi:MAG: DUF1749 domain-containing protein [Deltaproteobacteria bacterium]|nr:DUF1749 domain-containing protein [Deltaproteobacteria bacterium]
MQPHFKIVPFTATDGVELHGFLAGGRVRTAAIFLHGLGGNAYRSWLVSALAAACVRRRIGFFSINTRGHDLVSTRSQRGRRTPHNGSVYEIFTESVHDIRGAIRCLRARGVRTVYLLGHSTGANKIAYALQRGVRVAGVVYIAPGDDVGVQRRLLGPRRFQAMQRLAARVARRTPHALMPVQNLGYLPISAASYLSLFGPRNRMDQFPFSHLVGDSRWRRLARPRTRAVLVLGADDEYLPVPAAAIRIFFAQALPRIAVSVISGANHSFRDRETELARSAVEFITASGRTHAVT